MSQPGLPTLDASLCGWGRYPVIQGTVQRPEKASSFAKLIENDPGETLLAQGSARSYGDAAINSKGYTILTERMNRMLSFDEQTGRLRAEAGVTMQEVLETFVPRGWFPAVTPGTKYITLGGAVAFDVHGKNHHQDGAFSRHLHSLKILLASGDIVDCSAQHNPDLFWATVGGMGLTGIIQEVEFSLRRIETAYINSISIKAQNLYEAVSLFDKYESQYQYSVAWIDCLASGKHLGRSLMSFGNHASLEQLSPGRRVKPLQITHKKRVKIPFDFPAQLLNRYTMGCFNQAYFARQRAQEVQSVVDYDTFFYPLDFLQAWNRLYGKRGFVQYQCVFPLETSQSALVQMLQLCSQAGRGSFLAVLKRLGPQEGWLSFPMEGYTLALDMPVQPGLWKFLDRLDRLTIEFGGRVYLAKDARLGSDAFRAMYRDYPKWLAVKSRVDPDNRFTSNLAQRLQIEPVHERVGV